MFIEKSASFACTPAQLWELLTHPRFTKQYMFGCEILSDWQVGSSVLWEREDEEGNTIIQVKGEVLTITPGQQLTYTLFDPNMGLEDIPENYLQVSYAISEGPEGAQLDLSQGDYSVVADGEKRYQDSLGGWDMVLSAVQDIAKAEWGK
ncbi:MAG: SRPBCC domain-containing protein [Bacteroidota bacterium]